MGFPLPNTLTLKVFRHLSNVDLESLRTAFPDLYNLQETLRVRSSRVIVPFIRQYLNLGSIDRNLINGILHLFQIMDNPKNTNTIKITFRNEIYNYRWMGEGWYKKESLRGGIYVVRVKHLPEGIKAEVLSRKREIGRIFSETRTSCDSYETKLIYDKDVKYYSFT